MTPCHRFANGRGPPPTHRSRTVPTVELTSGTALRYVRHAFAQMLAVADRLGDERVNERPLGDGTNAVAALIFHCCGVAEFWLGHVGVGRPSTRDREAEFTRTGAVAELHAAVGVSLGQIEADLVAIDGGRSKPSTRRDASCCSTATSPTPRSSST